MTTDARREDFLSVVLPLELMLGDQKGISDPRPREDRIRFARGVLLGIAFCVPIWVLGWWATASHF